MPLYNPQTPASIGASPDWDLYFNGGTPYRESIKRGLIRDSTVALATTGVMFNVGIGCVAGDVISNITFRTGSVGLTTPTHWWFALYDNQATPALLSQSTDQLTTGLAGSTVITLALASPQTLTATGIYYAGLMFTAATVCNANGYTGGSAAMSAGVIGTQKKLNGTSGSALTTTAPATIASPGTSVSIPYVVLS